MLYLTQARRDKIEPVKWELVRGTIADYQTRETIIYVRGWKIKMQQTRLYDRSRRGGVNYGEIKTTFSDA